MDEKLKKRIESFKKKLSSTKEIYKGLIKHKCIFDSETKIFELNSQIPNWSEELDFDYEKEPYDFSGISGKELAEKILMFIKENKLNDCDIRIDYNCDGYFEDAYLVGIIARTKEDIEKEVEEFTKSELKKIEKKNDKAAEQKNKKKETELKILADLKAKYEK